MGSTSIPESEVHLECEDCSSGPVYRDHASKKMVSTMRLEDELTCNSASARFRRYSL
jgi:hypothetical protein